MAEYINMWRNFADFSGRSDFRDYWMAAFIHVVIIIILMVNDRRIHNIYLLISFIPHTSLIVRRLRDVGLEWYCIFVGFIPFVGALIMFYWLWQPSKGI